MHEPPHTAPSRFSASFELVVVAVRVVGAVGVVVFVDENTVTVGSELVGAFLVSRSGFFGGCFAGGQLVNSNPSKFPNKAKKHG